ncbi:DUF3006 domain-containing protein [Methanocella sp. CWC-04]|uniref:DUF3006 domain-containing protein n=1 Tax=Methanooceanicella nereidis TaxID=2052831 RepID=A0AAP2W7P8_9EURY|nr:DUF3006 family protein [Methanocella sp. CWC-04]MCD1295271.1 DUF3006 domain-containing protein [Methanocella sp. CWC-04]
MKATIDRIECEFAVLLLREDERISFDLPMAIMPEGCKEGDIVDIDISIDIESTEEAKERVSKLLDKLKSKKYPKERYPYLKKED